TTFPRTGTTLSAQLSARPSYALTVHAGISCLADHCAALLSPILATAALALTLHALLPLCTAVEAATAVALVCLEVYAPVVAAPLAFRAATNLVVSPPYAVLQAALRVPTTFPPQSPAIIIGQGHPWYGGQRGSQEGATHPPARPCPLRGCLLRALLQARRRSSRSRRHLSGS